MIITKIKANKRLSFRSDIYINGHQGFSLNNRTLVTLGLKEGDILTPAQLESYENLDLAEKAYQEAVRSLGRKTYTAKEMARRLSKHFPKKIIAQTLDKLIGQDLVNDERYVREFMEQAALRLYSGRKIQAELAKRGVERSLVADALFQLSPDTQDQSALLLLQKKARNVDLLDPATHEKLLAYLARRGFSYSVAKKALRELLDAE
jgi:regulatory protein